MCAGPARLQGCKVAAGYCPSYCPTVGLLEATPCPTYIELTGVNQSLSIDAALPLCLPFMDARLPTAENVHTH